MKGLLYRLQLLAFGLNSPKIVKKDTEAGSKSLVAKYSRGNINLQRGRYITEGKINKQRELLSKCQL